MRDIFSIVLLFVVVNIMAQLPIQYEYATEDCSAILSSYLGMVVVADNCEITSIIQAPAPGTIISSTTGVSLTATDATGNKTMMFFDVVILDTIPPSMQLNPEWLSYSVDDIGNMYKVYYGWVQEQGDLYNERVAGRTDTIFAFDSMYVHTYDSMKIFHGTIPILEYRIDEGYWSGETPNLTMFFQ